MSAPSLICVYSESGDPHDRIYAGRKLSWKLLRKSETVISETIAQGEGVPPKNITSLMKSEDRLVQLGRGWMQEFRLWRESIDGAQRFAPEPWKVTP